ncbi:ANTAR domain-containing protein [Streptomyces sp. TLI_55]|uniref:ANTAR domain-containing protein n=1 Tax=Streptomyces sp. TLI_55 TaxID=1938861 RepID=UPI0015CF0D51|nr:ANTAR domain-containing protein [Streptomyces sp. TLI_55]
MELQRERDQLKHAMESRPVIDMACGVLIAGCACTPHEAMEILLTAAWDATVAVEDVAGAITSATSGKPMPQALQEHVTAAVRGGQPRQT